MSNQTSIMPELYESFMWFLCTDMQVVLTGPKGEKGEKGDDGEPGISAKSVERVKFESKASLLPVTYCLYARNEKCYIQCFQNNILNFNLTE